MVNCGADADHWAGENFPIWDFLVFLIALFFQISRFLDHLRVDRAFDQTLDVMMGIWEALSFHFDLCFAPQQLTQRVFDFSGSQYQLQTDDLR